MQLRFIPPRPGATGRTHGQHQYPLPDGLSDGATVEVISGEGMNVTVRDAGGREWRLYHWQIDAGREYCGRAGNWLPESHPKVLAAIRDGLRRNLATEWPQALADNMAASRRDARAVLQRNGQDVHEFHC